MGLGLMSVGVLAAVLTCVLRHADAQDALSDWRQGIATFYGGAPDGMVTSIPRLMHLRIPVTGNYHACSLQLAYTPTSH